MSMQIVPVLLVIAAIIIFLSGERSISGFSIASIMSSKIHYWFAIIALILGFVLLLAEHRLEEKVKYDSNVKSFRRVLEKTQHRKVGYEEAEKLYKESEKKYWDAVGKGYVKHHYGKSLNLIEESTQPREIEPRYNQLKPSINLEYMHDKTLLRLAQEATNNMLVKRDVDHIIEELEKGNEQPGLTTKYISGSDGIIEYRTRRGARVYANRHGNNMNIVGLSDKSNQEAVIGKLKQKFPRK